jgi:hypothetical protein
MLDMVVDRREMKDAVARLLRFGRPSPVREPAPAVESEIAEAVPRES